MEILNTIEAAGLNVEYMYAFTFGSQGRAALIFRFDNPDAAITSLQASGINVIGGVELFARAGK